MTVTYTLTDCGALPTIPLSYGSWVNYKGQVLCSAAPAKANKASRMFVYDDGTQTVLKVPAGYKGEIGASINGFGDCVGTAFGTGAVTDIVEVSKGVPHLLTSDGDSWATEINDQGVVLGYTQVGAEYSYFLLDDGVTTPIPIPTGFSNDKVVSLNDTGDAVGLCGQGGSVQPFEFSDGESNVIPLPTGSDGLADAIDNKGAVLADVITHGVATKAEIYDGGVWTPLLPGAKADTAVNGIDFVDNGYAIGIITRHGDSPFYFAYFEGRLVDLNDAATAAGWSLVQVFNINVYGQVSGTATSGGVTHAVLFSPVITPG